MMQALVVVGFAGFFGGASAVGASSAAEDAMRALDMDGSGRVERADIEAFALSQGLTAAEVRNEFKDIDLNGDGELSADEIHKALSEVQSAPAVATASQTVAADRASNAHDVKMEAAASLVEAAPTPPPVVAAAVAQNRVVQQHTPAADRSLPGMSTVDGSSSNVFVGKATDAAGKALAEAFAQQAAAVLDRRSAEAKKAEQLETRAASLRGQAEALRHTAAEVTRRAASEAAEAVVRSTSDEVRRMEAEAAADERAAEERRQQAAAAMDRVTKAQSQMAAELQKAESSVAQ